jgi:hypothetical protein
MRKDLFTNFKRPMLDIIIEARNAAISETVKVKRILPFSSPQCGALGLIRRSAGYGKSAIESL